MRQKISFGLLAVGLVAVASTLFLQLKIEDFSREQLLSAAYVSTVGAVSSVNNSENNQEQEAFRAMSGLSRELSDSVAEQAKSKTSLQGTNQSAAQALQDLILQKAKERKIVALELMKQNPLLFLSLAMPASKKGLLSREAQNEIETERVVTGAVDVLHIDDFNNPKNSRFEYFLNTKDGRFNLYPVADLNMQSGTAITARGYVLDKSVVVDTNNNNVKITSSKVTLSSVSTAVPDSVGNQRTLVILLKSFPADNEPFTATQGRDLVFNGQFQNFMKEQSYGKVSFSGDVFGWVSLGKAITGGCMFLTNDQLLNAVNTYNINLGNYDRLVYLLSERGGGCSGVGKWSLIIDSTTYNLSQASVGLNAFNYPSNWGSQPFTWTNLDFVLSHEIGHSLGVLHANSWVCSDGQILYGDCRHQEYGNYFDTMGTMGYSLNYNGYFKEQLGWIPKKQVRSISRPGSYSISPLELNGGIKFAKVYIKDTTVNPYAIEFRKAIGFDSNLNNPNLSENQKGIFVNYIQDSGAPATELLDMSPVASRIEKATLNLPSANTSVYSFIDQGRGITIGPVTNVSSSSISFQVDLQSPSCERRVPVIDYTYYSSPVRAGTPGYVGVKITNQDYYGCGSSNFDIVPKLPSSWQYTVYPENDLTLIPSSSGYKSLSFAVPANTSSGIYTLSIEGINKTSGLKKKTFDLSITVTEPVIITSISPTSGPTGTVVTIKGTGFSNSGNAVNFGTTLIRNLTSASNTILFSVPSSLTPGVYPVSVTNTNSGGRSNALSFTVKPSLVPTITVLSPNGGETWTKGTTQTIKWQEMNLPPPAPCPECPPSAPGPRKLYDIQLVSYFPPSSCTSRCPVVFPRTIAKGVSLPSYDWVVGQVVSAPSDGSLNETALDGPYTVRICQSGASTVTSICDSSDSYFNIVSAPVPTGIPLLISGGTASEVRNNFSGWVGFQFKVGSTPLTVSQLGRYVVSGSSGTHIVKLATINTGTSGGITQNTIGGDDVPGGSVTVKTIGVPAGTYAYGTLLSPVTLEANTTYVLVSQELENGDLWYNYPNNQITLTNDAIPISPAWAPNNITAYYLPNTGAQTFGPVNLKYSEGGVGGASSVSPIATPSPSSYYTLTVSKSGTGSGTVTGSSATINCGTTCSVSLNAGTLVTLTATPASDGTFTGWTGACTGTETCTLQMSANRNVTAIFTAVGSAATASSGALLISGGTAGPTRNNFGGWVGFQFKVGSTPLTVSQLGRYVVSGSSGTHTVKLVNGNGTDIAGGSVTVNIATVPAGTYAYASLSQPITLEANTAYVLVSQELENGDLWYNYGNNAITLTNDAIPLSVAWAQNNTTGYNFSPSGNQTFGPVNLKYTKIIPTAPAASRRAHRSARLANVLQALRNLFDDK